MIISNWKIIRDQVGSLRVRGDSIDYPGYADGGEATTSAIQFADDISVTTKSGSVYYLGKPASDAEIGKLDIMQSLLPKKDTITAAPFSGIIEDWQPVNMNPGYRIDGKMYGSGQQETGKGTVTSLIKERKGNMVVTQSGSYYALGAPAEGQVSNIKNIFLSSFPEQQERPINLPEGTVIGGHPVVS